MTWSCTAVIPRMNVIIETDVAYELSTMLKKSFQWLYAARRTAILAGDLSGSMPLRSLHEQELSQLAQHQD